MSQLVEQKVLRMHLECVESCSFIAHLNDANYYYFPPSSNCYISLFLVRLY